MGGGGGSGGPSFGPNVKKPTLCTKSLLYITSWCLHSSNNKKLMLLSQMTDHEWFEGTLLKMALR